MTIKRTVRKPSHILKRIFFWCILAIAIVYAGCWALNSYTDIRVPPLPFFSSKQEISVPEGSVELHFIDVGQGDCILIRTSQQNVLIDGGTADSAWDTLAYLQTLGLEHFDLVISTHPHSDHYGGLRNILRSYPSDRFCMPQIPDNLVPTTISYTKLLTLLNEEEIPMQTLQPDDVIDLGSGAVLTVLGPQRNYEDLNNCSLILRLDFGRNSFLFTGDAESTAEQDLLQSGADLSADLLKVGHHGSSTSSSIDFLRAVRPDFAVISCGTSNDYGHPHQAALDRLAAIGCQTLRTDLSGTIIITSNGRQITCSYAMEAAA